MSLWLMFRLSLVLINLETLRVVVATCACPRFTHRVEPLRDRGEQEIRRAFQNHAARIL